MAKKEGGCDARRVGCSSKVRGAGASGVAAGSGKQTARTQDNGAGAKTRGYETAPGEAGQTIRAHGFSCF